MFAAFAVPVTMIKAITIALMILDMMFPLNEWIVNLRCTTVLQDNSDNDTCKVVDVDEERDRDDKTSDVDDFRHD